MENSRLKAYSDLAKFVDSDFEKPDFEEGIKKKKLGGIDPKALEHGIKCEMEEHGMEEEEATKIATDHLKEDPLYYAKEEEGEEDPNEEEEIEEMGEKEDGKEDEESSPRGFSMSDFMRKKPEVAVEIEVGKKNKKRGY